MMLAMSKSNIYATAFLVLSIAVIAAGYIYQNNTAPAGATNTGTTTKAGVFTAAPGKEVASADGNYTVHVLSGAESATADSLKAPDATRALIINASANMTAEAKTALQKSYAKTQAVLAKDKDAFNEWIFMGNINFIAGNYQLAREYWEYASARWPSNQSSFNNLGDLYMNYLKDYPKAEKNWLQAIKNKADDPGVYANLFSLYTNTSYKPSNTAAEDILKKGIAANPRAVNLQYDLAQYYKKLGRTADAQTMFKAAADNATSQGQTQLAAQIKADAAK